VGTGTDSHVFPESVVAHIAACQLAKELPGAPLINISPDIQHVDALVQLREL
jgi:hypothetical protein